LSEENLEQQDAKEVKDLRSSKEKLQNLPQDGHNS
jgi:hypothetical protein